MVLRGARELDAGQPILRADICGVMDVRADDNNVAVLLLGKLRCGSFNEPHLVSGHFAFVTMPEIVALGLRWLEG